MKIMKYGTILLFSVMLWGCGKGNPAAPVTVENTKKQHPADWANPLNHGANTGLGAKASAASGGGMDNCRSCHGSDFKGGISKVSCFNNAACHGATVAAAHAKKPWSGPRGTVVGTHKSADPGNATACFICHAAGNNSTLKPTAVPAPGAKPGCFNNTLCHAEGAHAFPFPGAAHAPGGSFLAGAPPFNNCSGCHDTTVAGAAYGFRPDCSACHKDVVHLNSNPGCGDCHGVKVGTQDGRPVGAVFPDRQFAHDVHTFAGVTCSACHNGYGSGSQTHGQSGFNLNPTAANVLINSSYQAETGSPASYDVGTGRCTDVSCHGGQQSPAWPSTGNYNYSQTLTCIKCHKARYNDGTFGTPAIQYNSYGALVNDPNSLHEFHMVNANPAIECIDCHDGNSLTSNLHFGGLTSTTMPSAEFSIRPVLNYRQDISNANKRTCFSVDTFSSNSGVECHHGVGTTSNSGGALFSGEIWK